MKKGLQATEDIDNETASRLIAAIYIDPIPTYLMITRTIDCNEGALSGWSTKRLQPMSF